MTPLKHYFVTAINYVSRIAYTFIAGHIITNKSTLFFLVYLIVTIQSYVLHSKITYKTIPKFNKLFGFIFLNSLISLVEYPIFNFLLLKFDNAVFSTSISAILITFLRYTFFKNYLLKIN